MIIGYYHQIFFGGGTYLKLSKKKQENKYKFEYCHSAIPNYIPKAEDFIKSYNTLSIKDNRFKEIEEKINVKNIEYTKQIDEIIKIIKESDWSKISKEKYTSDNLDDVCWDFYIEDDDNHKFLINGYSEYPVEIKNIYELLKKIQEEYNKF